MKTTAQKMTSVGNRAGGAPEVSYLAMAVARFPAAAGGATTAGAAGETAEGDKDRAGFGTIVGVAVHGMVAQRTGKMR